MIPHATHWAWPEVSVGDRLAVTIAAAVKERRESGRRDGQLQDERFEAAVSAACRSA
jgi:hypothetical protein